MKYILNDENFVTNIVVGTLDTNAIEADRGAGRIGDYYADGVFYKATDINGGVLNTESLTYSYDSETIASKKDAIISEITTYCDTQDAKDFEYPAASGLFYKVTDAIIKTLQRSSALEDTDPIPCNGGQWDTADGLTSTDYTVGELTELYNYGYDIPEANYTNMKNHIAAVSALETMAELIAYDYTTGWN